jgi:hypothetical protein
MPVEGIEKSENLIKLEEALGNLIQQGVTAIEGHTVPPERQNRKSMVALATYAAVSERAEGVLLMASNFKPDPAFVVLRSIQEGYLNLCYILQPDDDARLIAMFYGGAEDDLKRFKQLDGYLKANPRDESDTPGLDGAREAIAKLEASRDEAEEELAKINNPEFSKPHYPNLFERAERYDKDNEAAGTPTHLVLDYRMIYFYLSQYTHLGTSALGKVINDTPSEIKLNPENPVADCEVVLHSTFSILADTMLLTLGQIGASTEGLLDGWKDTASRLKPQR